MDIHKNRQREFDRQAGKILLEGPMPETGTTVSWPEYFDSLDQDILDQIALVNQGATPYITVPLTPDNVRETGTPYILYGALKANRCLWCLKPIIVQAFKGTGYCSDLHRKNLYNDHAPAGTVR